MELTIVVSVIAGLGFVSLRIKTMGFPTGWTQTTENSTIAAKIDALSPAVAGTETKTP
jgi:multidrug resistance efflux pump